MTVPEAPPPPAEISLSDGSIPLADPLADDPETVRTLARQTLASCRDNPGAPDTLPKLNTVLQLVHDPSLVEEILAAGDAVIRAVTADPMPPPAVHAHMTVLFALLLEYDAARDRVDTLFAAWLRHPRSFGPAHATPSEYQREAFFQRIGDMIGWGTLDVRNDHDALLRFCQWVDTWTTKNKLRARRAIELVRRNFPDPDLWDVIHLPPGTSAAHAHSPTPTSSPDNARRIPAGPLRHASTPSEASPPSSPANTGRRRRRRKHRSPNGRPERELPPPSSQQIGAAPPEAPPDAPTGH